MFWRTDFAAARDAMVDKQIARRGIRDDRILDAFRSIPRERFVSAAHASEAYGDYPLPIAAGQTISQPYIVALMCDAAEIGPSDKVLEVGAGSGYAAAILGRLAASVIAIERHHLLVDEARARMEALGCSNVRIEQGDGTLGWPADAPFDAILAAASGRQVPPSLIDQLAPGGRLVMPVGSAGWSQELVKVTKSEDGRLHEQCLGGVRFVPLIGAEA